MIRGGAAIILAVTTALWGCSAPSEKPGPASDGLFVEKAKKLAARDLKDPDTALFREGVVQRRPRSIGSAWKSTVVCGQIAGRNSYGAYAGFRRFIVEPGTGERRLEATKADAVPYDFEAPPAPPNPDFEANWNAACVGSGPQEQLKLP